MNKPFRLEDRIHSFGYAFAGVKTLIQTQHNAWIHVAATCVVVLTGFYFQVTASDWCWLVIAITSVWAAEAMNSAIEVLADTTHPDRHPGIKNCKDLAAAAVLFTAVGAAIIGGLVFWPYLFR